MAADRRWPVVIFALAASSLAAASAATDAPAITIRAASRAMQPGELVVLTVATRAPAASVHVSAFDAAPIAFRSDAVTWRVLVGVDLDVKPGSYPIVVDATIGTRPARATYPLVVRAKAFPTRTLTVDEAFVNPPAAVLPQIEADTAALNRCWANAATSRLWTGPFIRPVPQDANSAFGTRSVFNGQPRSPHSGADFLSPAGQPIKAPNAGRVVLAHELYYSGNTIVIDHGLGLFSLLAHLSEIDVQEGATVTAGEVVGLVGATGRVTGPHLHWSVRVGAARVDPLSLLALLGGQ